MTQPLDRFYPIFDSTEWLELSLPLGVQLVQLRIKSQDEDLLSEEIATAKAMCAEHGAQLIVNDHWEIAIEEGCDYIHLGQEDLDDANLEAIRAAGLRLGISTHDHAELERALSIDPDYIALGPVWPTILKKMAWTEQGLERVTEWKEMIGNIPLCAIGGLTPQRALLAFDAGADFAAVVTDITLSTDPEARVREWVETTR
ncbi:MAG: thiamine phosphate synthase [Pseudomonadota bacterium]